MSKEKEADVKNKTQPIIDLFQYEGDPEFEFDLLAIDIGERLLARMEQLNVKRTDLAEKMKVSEGHISEIFSGPDDLTLKALVAVANVLNVKIEMSLKCKSSGVIIG